MDREPSEPGRTTGTTGQADTVPPVGTAVITVAIDGFDEDTGTRPPRSKRVAKARTETPGAGAWRRNRALQTAGAAIVVALAVAFVYNLGGGSSVPSISGQPTGQASQAAARVDQARVAALMRKISANPKDLASFQSLSDLYFQAGDYQTASDWDQKVLGLDPNNVTGLLAHGAAQFNLGSADAAEADWRKVVALDPKQAEAYYDLGFLYLSKKPADMKKVRQMWNKVVEIDPTSDVAKTVRQHLQGLKTAAPSSSASTGN